MDTLDDIERYAAERVRAPRDDPKHGERRDDVSELEGTVSEEQHGGGSTAGLESENLDAARGKITSTRDRTRPLEHGSRQLFLQCA